MPSPSALLLTSLGDYDIYCPISGGKAGAGLNRTSSIQVRQGNLIVKQFRYVCDSDVNYDRALKKAHDYVKAQKSTTRAARP
jgi:hypothetical protein